MVKRLFAGLPTRPIYYLALTVFALVFLYYYGTAYKDCTDHAELRAAFLAAIQAPSESAAPTRLHLARLTDFEWDTANVVVNYHPSGATADCPFGWDWSEQQRDDLIRSGLLTIIVFLHRGKIVNYIEYNRYRAEFVGIENPYTPKTAVFKVQRLPTDRSEFLLSPSVPE